MPDDRARQRPARRLCDVGHAPIPMRRLPQDRAEMRTDDSRRMQGERIRTTDVQAGGTGNTAGNGAIAADTRLSGLDRKVSRRHSAFCRFDGTAEHPGLATGTLSRAAKGIAPFALMPGATSRRGFRGRRGPLRFAGRRLIVEAGDLLCTESGAAQHRGVTIPMTGTLGRAATCFDGRSIAKQAQPRLDPTKIIRKEKKIRLTSQ